MKRLLSVLLALLAFPVAAQNYPGKTVRIIVPFPAGGSTDVLARMIAQRLNESYGIQVEANLWAGIFAPAGTPKPIVNKLNDDIGRIMDTPQMKEWLTTNLGGEITRHTPEQFSAFLAMDATRWQQIIKQLGVQLD